MEQGDSEIRRTDCWITNIVQCWLPGNREPTKAEIEYCWPRHGAKELLKLEPTLRAVIPVGVPAMRVFIPGKVGERSAGSVYRRELREICPDPGGGSGTSDGDGKTA
jgi:uracil-DNA glycosylase family 4